MERQHDETLQAPAVHEDAQIRTASGRTVQLKVHRCLWSGEYPENSLPAVEECLRAPVARAEIDIWMLRDADFLVVHDMDGGYGVTADGRRCGDLTRREAGDVRLSLRGAPSPYAPPLFGDIVALVASIGAPTFVELDMQDLEPLPWPRVEELVRLVQPAKNRLIFNGPDWNLRRLLSVDADLLMSFDPGPYLDWVPEGAEDPEQIKYLPRGAYGYLDRHPLASRRMTSVEDYLADRLGGILRLVPGAHDLHLRLEAFERMLEDGVGHAAELIHHQNMALDVWTLDAGTPLWRERLARAVAAGADCVTTNTPHELAAAGRAL
jgi:glycerophosphoryl diester phosphodiesterase